MTTTRYVCRAGLVGMGGVEGGESGSLCREEAGAGGERK